MYVEFTKIKTFNVPKCAEYGGPTARQGMWGVELGKDVDCIRYLFSPSFPLETNMLVIMNNNE